MVDPGTVHRGIAIARLTKADVEHLLANYDADPSAALTIALRIVLEMPEADWTGLVATARFDDDRRRLLLSHDEASLDQLTRELNETRSLEASPGH